MLTKRKTTITKVFLLFVTACVYFSLCGCNEPVQNEPVVDKGMINARQVSMFNDVAMENAIIMQHTLYSYHFINNSEQLNELGHRDLSILIKHFKQYPGQLNVRQGDTSSILYLSRVQYVSGELQNAGVDLGKVSIGDDMAGGSGMASDDVVEIDQADSKARTDRRQTYPRISERSTNQ